MSGIIIPKDYKAILDIRETEIAIKLVKDFFERELAKNLNLSRVSAPLFVAADTGINDNLSGSERPVRFGIKEQDDRKYEIVHSLAKWKRIALKRYGFSEGEGLYTDMNAIRRDEHTDNLHSIYVDQWDWEKIISESQRDIGTLKEIVRTIYKTIKATEGYVAMLYSELPAFLPEDIYFITSQELEDMYPNLTSKERETEIAKKHGAVFIMQIGGALKSGRIHDDRAPDYDDWSLNGDIILYYPTLGIAVEVSSMGIRVDEAALRKQLEISDSLDRAELPFQKSLLSGELPQTVGGGIGQSRMCMLFLQKAHIGEVQACVWPQEMIDICEENNIALL